MEQKTGFSPAEAAVIGLGLIGGSLCKAIKHYTDCRVYGCDRDTEVLNAALEYGAVDAALDNTLLEHCGLVICALYPADTLTFLREHKEQLSPGCVVLDVCGVKEMVCREACALLDKRGVTFIGGHPMAGRELSGFAVSDKDLFLNASMVLTPFPDTDRGLLDELTKFIKVLGFRQIVDTTPEFHDKMIAYTSQLPHVVASSYVKSPTCRFQLGFTGGSFEDMSRVARMNAGMWTELFMANRENLTAEIIALCDHLNMVRAALEAGDGERLYAILDESSRIKEGLTE